MDNYIIHEVHISQIRKCDTILHTDGNVRTVGNNIKRSDLFGYTLFGDSYKLGRIKVKKLTFHTYEEIERIKSKPLTKY